MGSQVMGDPNYDPMNQMAVAPGERCNVAVVVGAMR